MAVTEIALLRLRQADSITSPEVLTNLQKAKSTLDAASKASFGFYHCIEDPALIYLVGGWTSVEAHHQFLPSRENQELLAIFKDQLTVEWMFHVDIPLSSLATVQKAKTFTVGRHFISPEQKAPFENTFNDGKGELESFIEGKELVVGGWRVDKDQGKEEEEEEEEFVLFTGWESRDRHFSFAETEGFKKYSKIRDNVKGADIKHSTRLDI